MIEILLLGLIGLVLYFLFYRGYIWLFFLFLFCSWGGKNLIMDMISSSSHQMILFMNRPISYAYFFAALISFITTVYIRRKIDE